MTKPNPRRTNSSRRNKLRARVLAAYDTCHICGKPVDKTLNGTTLPGAPEVDELIPVSRGGSPYDFNNCRLAHRYCNRQRSNHTVAYARAQIKSKYQSKITRPRLTRASKW
ncbi:HNH endonuclease [Alloscardovia omnicolens]|uniref:HNH endonuclease n=1 Tax=Actinomycetes TaxID=1760 RepID=UPI0003B2F208|nr:HNH endonuclease signature motif containing protein [Alloscardovia omnicolens]